MKKLFAVLLALTLILSMGITAFAADETTGTITIENAISGEEYTIYKMFSYEPINTEKGFYTVVPDWAAFIAEGGDGAAYLRADTDNGTIEWIGETEDDGKTPKSTAVSALAKAAVAYAKANNIAATQTATAAENSTTVTFTDVDLGYYAIDTSLGNICALTNANSTETYFEKNSGGSIDKHVKENGSWVKENDASIGDTVEFRATITTGKGTSNYVMHDTMSDGLTFNADSVVVTIKNDDNSETELTLGTDYNVTTENLGDDCTFEVDFTDSFEADLEEGKTIYVTYSAILNEDALIYDEANPNNVYLSYGNNQKTNFETTKTYTYQFQLVKTDASNVVLPGAKFQLYNVAEGGDAIRLVKEANGEYRVAVADEELGENEEFTYVIDAGYVTIKGLDSGTYYLEETEAPEGYNKLTERKTVVIEGKNENATVTDNVYVEGGVQVINKTGSLLPETGGIGTTIFYIVGGLLMVAAVVFLVSKKRMAAFA